MDRKNRVKLKNMILAWRSHFIATSTWLKQYEIYPQLAERYVRNGWLTKLAAGIFIKSGDTLIWPAIVSALQRDNPQQWHVGARAALELRGYAHYGRVKTDVHLFAQAKVKQPVWVKQLALEKVTLNYTATNLLGNSEIGISSQDVDGFDIRCSTLERAILEMLAFIPQHYGYHEAAHLMASLKALRPNMVQSLLEACNSVKAKRLFLHLATLCQHRWLPYVDLTHVDLGSGVRKLAGGTVFDKHYQLYVPETQLNEGYSLDELREHFP